MMALMLAVVGLLATMVVPATADITASVSASFNDADPDVSLPLSDVRYSTSPAQVTWGGDRVSWLRFDARSGTVKVTNSFEPRLDFKLGTLTHDNREIGLQNGITGVDLRLSATIVDTTRGVTLAAGGEAQLGVFETPNAQRPCPFQSTPVSYCPDKITLDPPKLSDTVNAGNVAYTFETLGFGSSAASAQKEMITEEFGRTSVALWGTLKMTGRVKADAGDPQTVNEGDPVTLDGTDSRVTGLLYTWERISGPAVTLTGANTATPSFTAPELTETATVTFRLTVKDAIQPDEDELTDTDTVTVTIIDVNDPPTVDPGGPYVVYEGSDVVLDDAISFDPDDDPLVYEWTPDTQLTGADTLNPTFHGIDDAVDELTVTVTDPFGEVASATTQVTTLNVPPATNLGADVSIYEGDTFLRSGIAYSDAGVLDTHTATVDYGDGSGVQALALVPGPAGSGTGTFDLSHLYYDDDPTGTPVDTYTLTVTITDDDGGSVTDELVVTVSNLDPGTEAGESAVIDEGDRFYRELAFDDIGSLDTHVVEADYGEGAGFEAVAVDQSARTYVLDHVYADDDPTATPQDDYVITVRVTDDDTGVVEDTIDLTVRDVAPSLTITSPSFDGDLYEAPVTIDLVAPFTDPGVRDTFICTIDWDEADATDGVPVPPTEFAAPFAGTEGNCDASNVYEQAGVYTIRVMVTDDDTLYDVVERTIVVYDPGAGFVTGGGWFDSPEGAYVPDPTVAGRAHFGFVAKYKKGVAEGNTEFQLQAGDLNFHSEAYDWLVVTANGTRAQYKGTGTINGESGYGFIMTVYDNGEPGAGVDQARMKIWNTATGELVYDNRMGASDDVDRADPQIISHGNIQIHWNGRQ